MPFCKTATRVEESQSRASHGAADDACWALVHNRTQSTGLASAGFVRARRETSTFPSGRSRWRWLIGWRTQAMTSCRSAARRHPVATPPILPRPMTAMVERWRDGDGAIDTLLHVRV